jgi:hypothetical protein
MTAEQPVPTASIRTVGDPPDRWHLVEYGTWQVSIAPDGLLMLPRHVHPREVQDFVSAMLAAAEVAEKARESYENDRKKLDLSKLPGDSLIVTEGPPPPGAVKAVITSREGAVEPRSSIGRTKRGRAATVRDPRQPRKPQPPGPPMPGGRNG